MLMLVFINRAFELHFLLLKCCVLEYYCINQIKSFFPYTVKLHQCEKSKYLISKSTYPFTAIILVHVFYFKLSQHEDIDRGAAEDHALEPRRGKDSALLRGDKTD